MKNKFFCLILIFSISFSSVSFGSNPNTRTLVVNNVETNIILSQEFNGDYFLPIKDVIVNLGGSRYFNPETFLIRFSLNGKSLDYKFNENIVEYKSPAYTKTFNNYFDIKLIDNKAYISLSFLQKFFDISYEDRDGKLAISSLESLANNIIIKPLFISHAGGEVYGIKLSNSLEAIESSIKKGSRLIELDFLKTSDGKYVLGHDWGNVAKIFSVSSGIYKYDDYISMVKGPLTPIGIDCLMEVLDENPSLRIVTDIKYNNMDFLRYLQSNYSEYIDSFLPQVYAMDEYHYAKSLGFEDIIYSLYKNYLTDQQVIDLAKSTDLYAITMAESRTQTNLGKRLRAMGMMTYVHTVNDMTLIDKYMDKGISGFYSDKLY